MLSPVTDRAQRLKSLREDSGLSLEFVGSKIGKSFETVRRYENNPNTKIKLEILQILARLYKTSVEYIKTGRHALSNPATGQVTAFPNDVYAEGFLIDMYPVDIPHLDANARASFIELGLAGSGSNFDLSHLDTVRLYVSGPEEAARYKNALVFTVAGDSMEPLMYTGDRVIGWQIPEPKWEQVHNKVCVIAYDETVTIKAIRENELFTKGILTLRAQNQEAGFLPVRREQISSLWQIDEFFDRPKVRL